MGLIYCPNNTVNPYAGGGYFGQCKTMQTIEKCLNNWYMGTHLMRVPSESYPMNTNTTGFRLFSKSWLPCALDESSLKIGSVKEKYKHQRVCSDSRMFHDVVTDRSLVLTSLLPTAQVRISAGACEKLPMT